jgi:hypothetical protein
MIGVSPPELCVSWGVNDRYLFVLRWHILTGRLRGRPLKKTVSCFWDHSIHGLPWCPMSIPLGIDGGLEEVFSCH